MATEKNFEVKHGLTAGSVTIDSASGVINTSASGAAQTKINLKIITASTGSMIIPSGSSLQRDSVPSVGYTRYNTDLGKVEIYDGVTWSIVGSGNAMITTTTGSFITPTGTTAQRDASPSTGYLRFNTTTTQLEVFNGSTWDVVGAGSNYAAITSQTGALVTPSGTTAQRPSVPSSGYLRFNTTTSKAELYNGVAWVDVGSGVVVTGPSGSLMTPSGTTAERDAVPEIGYFRFNTDIQNYEGYTGTEWVPLSLILAVIDGGTYGAAEAPPGASLDGGTF